MQVLLFGVTKDIIGSPSLSIAEVMEANSDLPKTVKELKGILGEKFPDLTKLSSLAIAVNNNYAHDEDQINSFDEIALIPPVSGG